MTKHEVLVYYATKHLGKPYTYGAKPYRAPKEFDCSSFTQYLYKRIGIDLPRTAIEQASYGEDVSIKNMKIGDLLFMRGKWGRYSPEFPSGIGHVGMYMGDNKVINARYKKDKNGQDNGAVITQTLKEFLNGDSPIIKRIL